MSRVVRKPVFFAYAKTKTQISFAVTAKLISAFVFATRIVQSLYFLNPKFQASSHLLWLNSPVLSNLVGNPEDRFSHNEAQMCNKQLSGGSSVCTDDNQSLKLVAYRPIHTEEPILGYTYMSLVVRKPVFGVSDTVPHKPGCTATEDG